MQIFPDLTLSSSYFWFDDDKWIKYIFSQWSQDKWSTISFEYTQPHMEDDWENWHTLDRMYVTIILEVKYFQIRYVFRCLA